MYKLSLEKAEESYCQYPLDHGEKQGSSRKTSTSTSLTTRKPLTVDHNKLWKILKEKGVPDHLTCLLRNQNEGQDAIVRTEHGTIDWFKTGKGVRQGCILSSCLSNFREYIMQNTGLDESQAGLKIARENINNLRYVDNTTLTAESEKELKSILMRVKDETEKSWLETGH